MAELDVSDLESHLQEAAGGRQLGQLARVTGQRGSEVDTQDTAEGTAVEGDDGQRPFGDEPQYRGQCGDQRRGPTEIVFMFR